MVYLLMVADLMSGSTELGVKCGGRPYFGAVDLGDTSCWFSTLSGRIIDLLWLYDVLPLGCRNSWRTASSGVIRFLGSQLRTYQVINICDCIIGNNIYILTSNTC